MNKIYIVTSGCYSDYYIDKVFSTKPKAEEYKKWCGDDDAHIETYVIDEINTDDKYYCISTELLYKDGHTNVMQSVCKGLEAYNNLCIYKYSGMISVSLTRSIRADNYNPDFHNKRCEKAIYDYLAIAKQKLNEGCSVIDINLMFGKEVINDSKNY